MLANRFAHRAYRRDSQQLRPSPRPRIVDLIKLKIVRSI